MQYHLNVMAMVRREAQLAGVTLGPDEAGKFSECSCLVASMKQGAPEIWTGTITQVEDYLAELERTPGGTRTEKEALQAKYRHELVLLWADGPGHMVGRYTIEGRKSTHAETTDQNVRQRRRHRRRFRQRTGRWRYWRRRGRAVEAAREVPHQLPRQRRDRVRVVETAPERRGVSDLQQRARPRRVDVGHHRGLPADRLDRDRSGPDHALPVSGSKVLDVRDERFDTQHRPKITWDLERCGG